MGWKDLMQSFDNLENKIDILLKEQRAYFDKRIDAQEIEIEKQKSFRTTILAFTGVFSTIMSLAMTYIWNKIVGGK